MGGKTIRQQSGDESDDTEELSDLCDFGFDVVSKPRRGDRPATGDRFQRQHMVAEPAARAGLMLIDPLSPTTSERQRARNRRRVIYAAIYSVGGLVVVGKLLFAMLAAMN